MSIKRCLLTNQLFLEYTFDMAVWKEEVFGPVLPIIPFDSEDEAIAFANDSQYGLGGYIYTQNKERALKVGRHYKLVTLVLMSKLCDSTRSIWWIQKFRAWSRTWQKKACVNYVHSN